MDTALKAAGNVVEAMWNGYKSSFVFDLLLALVRILGYGVYLAGRFLFESLMR